MTKNIIRRTEERNDIARSVKIKLRRGIREQTESDIDIKGKQEDPTYI